MRSFMFFLFIWLSVVYSQEDETFSDCIEGIEEFIFINNQVDSIEANEVCESLRIGAVGITIPDTNTYERVKIFLRDFNLNFEGFWLNLERNPGEREVTDYVSREEGVIFEEGFADTFGINPWLSGQPSFDNNEGNAEELCVEMKKESFNFEWNDKECGRTASTLCRRSCSPTALPTLQPTLFPSKNPTTSPSLNPSLSPQTQNTTSNPTISLLDQGSEFDLKTFEIIILSVVSIGLCFVVILIFFLLKSLKNNYSKLNKAKLEEIEINEQMKQTRQESKIIE